MTFDEYQSKTNDTAVYHEKISELFKGVKDEVQGFDNVAQLDNIENALNLAYVGLGLGESGECQGKIKKIIRDSGGAITEETRIAIMKELGDQLWYISETCNMLTQITGVSTWLHDCAVMNAEKLASRKERGVLEGSGDNR